MIKERKPSIKKISEITGFSPATVSNAINNKKGVNKETADKIFEVAKELGYSNSPKSIKNIKFVVIRRSGEILDESSFHTAVIEGVELEARENKLETVFVNLDVSHEDYQEQVKRLTSDTGSAIILLGTEMNESDFKLFEGCKCPLILLDSWNDDWSNCDICSSVLINNFDSARTAVEYLISKGHTSIGYLRGSFRIKAFKDREMGYKVTLFEHELELNENNIITVGTKTEKAYQDMHDYLSTHKNIPTAFFADNDVIALGAIRALIQNGYKIPEDVSIVGFDDIVFSSISAPPLSTLHVYKQEMGREAVRRLLSIINTGENSRFKVESCTTFIERESVKDIR